MKGLMEEYGTVIVYCIIGFVVVTIGWFLISTSAESNVPKIPSDNHVSSNEEFRNYEKPTISIDYTCRKGNVCSDVKIDKGDVFDYMITPNVKALDGYGRNITSDVVYYLLGDRVPVDANGKTTTQGVYAVRYVVENQYGMRTEERVKIIVE